MRRWYDDKCIPILIIISQSRKLSPVSLFNFDITTVSVDFGVQSSFGFAVDSNSSPLPPFTIVRVKRYWPPRVHTEFSRYSTNFIGRIFLQEKTAFELLRQGEKVFGLAYNLWVCCRRCPWSHVLRPKEFNSSVAVTPAPVPPGCLSQVSRRL